jgi:hypothetical protein
MDELVSQHQENSGFVGFKIISTLVIVVAEKMKRTRSSPFISKP